MERLPCCDSDITQNEAILQWSTKEGNPAAEVLELNRAAVRGDDSGAVLDRERGFP